MGDTAEIGRLTDAIVELLPHLEAVWRWDTPEPRPADRSEWLAELDRPLPDAGVGLDQVLDELARLVVPYGPRAGKPGFSGFIVNGPTTTGVVANLAATAASPHRYLLTAPNHLEAMSLQWLQSLLGVPARHQGVYSTGGSVANLVALGAARQAAYEARGVDPAADGIDGPGRIYASVEAHNTIARSAAVLGLGRHSVHPIPVDDHQRMDVDAVADAIAADREAGVLPVAIVGTAGTTNTGAIDPLDELADVAGATDVWFHVDGAYGLLAAAVPELAPRFAGVARADSVIVDPHKWLCTPIGIGASFVRDRDLLHRAFTEDPADYLEGTFAPEAVGVDLRRHGRAVRRLRRRADRPGPGDGGLGRAPRARPRRCAGHGAPRPRLRPAPRRPGPGRAPPRADDRTRAVHRLLPLCPAGGAFGCRRSTA